MTGVRAYRLPKNWSRPTTELLPTNVPTGLLTVGVIELATLLLAVTTINKVERRAVDDYNTAAKVCRMRGSKRSIEMLFCRVIYFLDWGFNHLVDARERADIVQSGDDRAVARAGPCVGHCVGIHSVNAVLPLSSPFV